MTKKPGHAAPGSGSELDPAIGPVFAGRTSLPGASESKRTNIHENT